MALPIQEYDIRLIYQSGRKCSDADSLYRLPLPSSSACAITSALSVPPFDLDSFAAAQPRDPWIASLLHYLTGPLNIPESRSLQQQAAHFGIRD